MAAVCELKDCTVVVAKVAAWKSLQCGSMSLLNIFIAGLSPVSLIYDNEIEMRADAEKLREAVESEGVLS
jgi:hypothetical protein